MKMSNSTSFIQVRHATFFHGFPLSSFNKQLKQWVEHEIGDDTAGWEENMEGRHSASFIHKGTSRSRWTGPMTDGRWFRDIYIRIMNEEKQRADLTFNIWLTWCSYSLCIIHNWSWVPWLHSFQVPQAKLSGTVHPFVAGSPEDNPGDPTSWNWQRFSPWWTPTMLF